MSNLERMLQAMMEATQVSSQLKVHNGRSYGRSLGIVTDREDPAGLGRIKATIASKGGRFDTDWLTREVTCSLFSPPVPKLGDTVWVGYTDGDPHKGYYQGVVQNNINPAWDRDSLKLVIGSVELTIEPNGRVILKGCTNVTVESTDINLRGDLTVEGDVSIQASSVDINGAQVLTIGSRDTDNDISITRGW